MPRTIRYDARYDGIGNDIAAILECATHDVHLYFVFKNGHAASVIRRPGSYGDGEGLFELMVAGEDDVSGWLTPQDVQLQLKLINALERRH